MSDGVLLLGATGTIGRAVHAELARSGREVFAPGRPVLEGARAALATGGVGAVISCLASRDGLDAWDVDHGLNSAVLREAVAAGVERFVLLSAICVQKPRLAFQHAKLAFEAELRAAPLTWSIVRPTAYFKSLSGQVARLRAGKPFLVFGNGQLTATKPISDQDTARYLVRCLDDVALEKRILPIGGPGAAITPMEQGELLFSALGLEPRFANFPPGILRAAAAVLGLAGAISPPTRGKAELARIGYYYATQSMLVWDAGIGRYDADATPGFGEDILADHYARLAAGEVEDPRGAHAVF
jgi:divinyl chlorophyllide a 8-vinyl-reductase